MTDFFPLGKIPEGESKNKLGLLFCCHLIKLCKHWFFFSSFHYCFALLLTTSFGCRTFQQQISYSTQRFSCSHIWSWIQIRDGFFSGFVIWSEFRSAPENNHIPGYFPMDVSGEHTGCVISQTAHWKPLWVNLRVRWQQSSLPANLGRALRASITFLRVALWM